ncbi:hypothetical protein CRENPOLYSF1_940005 [Crenothrix polyspora]|uniref:Uncharacterized protein n=1 Tax=Crenothrix polyspora TaxID=360316 RepID=A0A1R4HK18_9GAMM|nr:hypothetical protein CRENPOLYSF1_940005 [Crenothrix polyspora]
MYHLIRLLVWVSDHSIIKTHINLYYTEYTLAVLPINHSPTSAVHADKHNNIKFYIHAFKAPFISCALL